jgi:hypothetical protein
VAISRVKAPRDVAPERTEWILGIAPLQDVGAKELMFVSEHVHEFFISTPGITALRWFFNGWNRKTPAVRTPDELGWCTGAR